MGVYIPNMEMPTVCVTDDGWYGNCPMDRVWCAMRFKPEYEAGQRIIDEITGKLPAWCPLRPLPEKHGRLGDLDEVKTAFPCGESVRTECVRATIDNMPTIVEAEVE